MRIVEISPLEAQTRLARGEAVALDVREPSEWECGRIAGALHIPMAELARRRDELPSDVPIIAVCRSGSRSAHVTAALVRAGYQAENLSGGLKGWQAAGLPLDPPGGFVA